MYAWISRTSLRETCASATAIIAAAVLGVSAGEGYETELLIFAGVVAVCVSALRSPHLLLCGAGFAVLAGGSFASVAGVGQVSLILGGILATLKTSSRRFSCEARIVIPAVLLLWLSVRLTIDGGYDILRPLAACLGAMALTYVSLREQRDIPLMMTWGGVVFLALSWWLGELDHTGLRFQGISGNPNRMTFGLLVAVPFFIDSAFRARRRSFIALLVAAVIQAVWLISISGSDQGTVGCIVLVVLAIFFAFRRMGRVGFVLMGGVVGVLAFVAIVARASVTWTTDELTLSGRTPLYRAGWQEFLNNPIFGSGNIHVSDTLTAARSAHNSIISLAASAGTLALALWIILLVTSVVNGVALIQAGRFYGAAAVSVVVTQLVQQIELMPLTWMILTVAAQRSLTGRRSDDPLSLSMSRPAVRVKELRP